MLSTRLRAGVTICVLGLGLWACGDDSGSGASGAGGATGGGDEGGQATTGGGGQGGSSTQGGGGQAEGGSGGVSACEAAIADAYDGAAFATNGAVELTLRSQLGALNGAMRAAEMDLGVTPTAVELQALYEAGDPSLRDVTSAYYDGIVLEHFERFAAAAGNTWTPADPPVGAGGKYGSYIFSAEGIDLRQGVEKGSFEAAFFNHAWSLREQPFDLVQLDRLLASYGAHPTFPGDSETTDPLVQPNPDRLGAQYAERRSPKDPADASQPMDPDAPGPYFRVKAAFLAAQAAIALGAECDAELDAAIDSIYAEWERVMFATVVYYLNDAYVKLTVDNPTLDQLAGGLHGFGEVVGFVHGWKGLPADARTITDAEIDELLETLGAPAEGDVLAYELLTNSATAAPRLLAGIDQVASVYGFTPQELESFETNH
jgi:hypothetical protein